MTEKTGKELVKGHNKGTFAAGVSGNPAGRPRGARNRVTIAIEALLEGEAEALTRKVIERALEGDATALRLCLDRLAPPRRDRPAPFDLPPIRERADVRAAFAAIIAATAEGDLTPSEDCIVRQVARGLRGRGRRDRRRAPRPRAQEARPVPFRPGLLTPSFSRRPMKGHASEGFAGIGQRKKCH